jgi:hypothetical protein
VHEKSAWKDRRGLRKKKKKKSVRRRASEIK